MLSNTNDSVAVVWFRRDLRLLNNPALCHAAQYYRTVIPVYIHSPSELHISSEGSASRWWLHHSLAALDRTLQSRGSRLILRSGTVSEQLTRLMAETSASAVFWNRRYEPDTIERDSNVKASLKRQGITAESFNGSLLHEPWDITSQSGKPYQVFTPFWKACLARQPVPSASSDLEHWESPPQWPVSESLAEWNLLPAIPWDTGFGRVWNPGESGAHARLQEFMTSGLSGYAQGRDVPASPGTSRLSPHLHFGEISPRQIWAAVQSHRSKHSTDIETFLREIGWREFAHHILYHFPKTPESPLRESFQKFPWVQNPQFLRAWQRGKTGYPIVDAGMRELWTTGWMHNRVRMIVGSFLTKHLRISWQEGARWFWDTLVDADLANNTLGWQWIGGCGADAAPYFRVFNPMTQGEKFDPNGEYVRRWVPELAPLPNSVIHQPWTATASQLSSAGLRLGHDYPHPIVDHSQAREQALLAFSKIKE